MNISDLLKHKGSAVATITAEESVARLVEVLSEQRVGALVVLGGRPERRSIEGIVSERDVVHALSSRGAAAMAAPVGQIMTPPVVSCSPADGLEEIARLMTDRRFRHLPVVQGGELAGIVSIGDVVAARIRQLEADRQQLESYISQ
ncbi:MAG: histidine kinase [Frankiales bacterium]|nr:histidine kinase [Frankiales bacterium]